MLKKKKNGKMEKTEKQKIREICPYYIHKEILSYFNNILRIVCKNVGNIDNI